MSGPYSSTPTEARSPSPSLDYLVDWHRGAPQPKAPVLSTDMMEPSAPWNKTWSTDSSSGEKSEEWFAFQPEKPRQAARNAGPDITTLEDRTPANPVPLHPEKLLEKTIHIIPSAAQKVDKKSYLGLASADTPATQPAHVTAPAARTQDTANRLTEYVVRPPVSADNDQPPLWKNLTTRKEPGQVLENLGNGQWRVLLGEGETQRKMVFNDAQVAAMTGMFKPELEVFKAKNPPQAPEVQAEAGAEQPRPFVARSAPHLMKKATPEFLRELVAAQKAVADLPHLEQHDVPVLGSDAPEKRMTAAGQWKVEDLQKFLQDPMLRDATPPQRQQLLNDVLEKAGKDFMNRPDFTQEDYLNYQSLAQQMRQQVEAMTTLVDQVNGLGDVAENIGTGALRSGIALGADITVLEPDAFYHMDEELPFRAPLGNVAKHAGHWFDKLGDSVNRKMAWNADEELEKAMTDLRKDLEEGKIPMGDRAAFETWVKGYSDRLSTAQAQWYEAVQGTDKKITIDGKEQVMDKDWLGTYSKFNSLDSSQHAALLNTFFRTQDPRVLNQLRESLKNTPERVDIEHRQKEDLEKSDVVNFLTQSMGGGGYSEAMKEAGNPLDLASNLVPFLRGARAAGQAGSGISKIARGVAGSVAANAAMEAMNMMVENPEATLEDYRAAGRDMLATSLGMHALGAASAKTEQALEKVFDGAAGSVLSHLDEKTAALKNATAQQKVYDENNSLKQQESHSVNDIQSISQDGSPPTFLRIQQSNLESNYDGRRNERTYQEREDRDPGRALESLRQSASGKRPTSTEKTVGGTDGTESNSSGYRLSPLNAEELESGLSNLNNKSGAEHEVYFDAHSNHVVKLTKVGEVGAQSGGLEGYLQRLAWTNEIFGDVIKVEGSVFLAGESAPRVVTTQPWYRASESRPEPTQKEIDIYMRKKGFLKAYDGAYLHESKSIAASDAVPKNFIRTEEGHVHPVDVILIEPGANQHDRLQNMVNNHPQVVLPPSE